MNKEKFNIFIGEQLKAFRKKQGLLQKDIVEALGITQATLSNYEKGRHHLPLDVFFLFCKKYKRMPSEIITDLKELNKEERNG